MSENRENRRQLGKHKLRWECGIKMDIKEKFWVHLQNDTDAFSRTVINILFS